MDTVNRIGSVLLILAIIPGFIGVITMKHHKRFGSLCILLFAIFCVAAVVLFLVSS